MRSRPLGVSPALRTLASASSMSLRICWLKMEEKEK
jgi:hypothetical protein